MARFSDLHLDLLARGVLQRGETLLGTAIASHGPWWALGLRRRTCVLLATPWRLVLLEHRRSQELTAMMTIPWRHIQEVRSSSTKLRLRAQTQIGPIARTMRVTSADAARRIAEAFDYGRAPKALRLVQSEDRTVAFRRQGPSLEGTWRLLAVEGRRGHQTLSTPFGRHPVGQLVYMPNGRMSVMIMAANRAKFGTHGLGGGTGPEKAAAFDSFLAYSGRYERLENRVIHYPDVASIPDFVAVPEERFVSLEGDRLILSTPPMVEHGELRTFVIVWQRTAASLHVAPPPPPLDDAPTQIRRRRSG